MKDKDIRKLFLPSLNGWIYQEIGINNGSVRVDVANISTMTGYEIKSDTDNLKRLPRQVKCYDQVFKFNYLLTTKKHVVKSLSILPVHWGIYIFNETDYSLYREASPNKKRNKRTIGLLLWKYEILRLLKELDLATGYETKRVHVLRKRLIENIGFEALDISVLNILTKRLEWKINRKYIC